MKHAEVHLNRHTLETRHRYVEYDGNAPSCPQASEGWQPYASYMADRHPDLEEAIATAKINAVKTYKDFWQKLAQDPVVKVICNGYVFVVFDPDTMVDLGSRSHRVYWKDPTRPAEVCRLIPQGPLPNWIRDAFPENVTELQCAESGMPDISVKG